MTTAALDPNVHLTYLAEGAANIVYRIHPPLITSIVNPTSPSTPPSTELESYGPSTPPPTEVPEPSSPDLYKGHLLRLRKSAASSVPVQESHVAFITKIAPLFPAESLVSQTLIVLPPGLLKRLNSELRGLDGVGTRATKRRGTYLDEEEEYGRLVGDMTGDGNGDGEGDCVALEFKPKWLVQSPTAPKEARRCRTCALSAMRIAASSRGTAWKGVCPLKLLAGNIESAREAVDIILKSRAADERVSTRLVEFICTNELVKKLRQLQEQWDRQGVLGRREVDEDLSMAMTVRDCTLFLKIPTNPTMPIEARLGDLDLKPTTREKLLYWQNIERRLIDEGWYTTTEKGPAMGRNHCRLAETC
ncbi:uncharacterized protein KY384_002948 [Bacidia gigantensis]|uniref:uncharacterized protein n=1 Tax=Bacidia gigantensis TaxID=2732470 RepID=UPI001D038798|nr:uncharacterized protein KY384_002948 [Bacidia gigantensis]KAG8531319.1 hypothetical protein KY384_002948 [Bacidia gigantensis]